MRYRKIQVTCRTKCIIHSPWWALQYRPLGIILLKPLHPFLLFVRVSHSCSPREDRFLFEFSAIVFGISHRRWQFGTAWAFHVCRRHVCTCMCSTCICIDFQLHAIHVHIHAVYQLRIVNQLHVHVYTYMYIVVTDTSVSDITTSYQWWLLPHCNLCRNTCKCILRSPN